MLSWQKQLQEKIIAKQAIVGIIGLGYVGGSLAKLVVQKGYRVIGFDKDPARVTDTQTSLFSSTTNMNHLEECDIIIICVQTPVYEDKTPNFTYLQNASEEISQHMHQGMLITIESSVNPGVTRNLVLPILETSTFTPGEDFAIAFSPERIDPGNKDHSLEAIPKVVSGYDEVSLSLIQTFYENVFHHVIPVSTLETAEMVKIFENTFRFINISLVNELKEYTEKIDVDMWEVVRAAATKPFGFLAHYPSPGVGGHCIPVDPFYLYADAKKRGVDIGMIHLAGAINDRQPNRVVQQTLAIMRNQETVADDHFFTEQTAPAFLSLTPELLPPRFYKNFDENQGMKGGLHAKNISSFKQYNILLVGVAYKPDIDDIRESAALRVWDIFEDMGHHVSYHDPYVASIRGEKSLPLSEETLAAHDIAVIITKHTNINYQTLAAYGKPIVDTQHVYSEKLSNIYYV